MKNNALIFHNPAATFDPTPFVFCHTVKAPSNGELVYISAQSGGEGQEHTLSEDFRHQVKPLLVNLSFALKSHDLKFADVMKITILIVEHSTNKLAIVFKPT